MNSNHAGSSCVLRGGYWNGNAQYCRSAFRINYSPDYRSGGIGVRLVTASMPRSHRVFRGGYWGSHAQACRSAGRTDNSPGDRYGNIGVRLVATSMPHSYHVARGGRWSSNARNCRSALRSNSSLDDRYSDIGVRLVATSMPHSDRVLRGGAWGHYAQYCRSAYRDYYSPDDRYSDIGVRLVATSMPRSIRVAPEEITLESVLEFLSSIINEIRRTIMTEQQQQPLNEVVVPLDLPDGATPMVMMSIPAGKFLMGSPDGEGFNDEHPQHEVEIEQPFFMAKYEVTQAQWAAIMGQNPSYFKNGPDAMNQPVERVSWDDCQKFCAEINKLGYGTFSLPTEEQWEYACRAGTTYATYWGPGECTDDHAWNCHNSEGRTHPVGQKRPNAWGLHDMCGNVWEWCNDRYAPYPKKSTAPNARVL